MFWISVIFAIFLFYFTNLVIQYFRIEKMCGKIPNVKGGLPIIGMLHKVFFNYSTAYLYLIDKVLPMSDQTLKLNNFNYLAVAVQSPEDIQTVLTSSNCINKTNGYSVFSIHSGDRQALIICNANRWHRLRNLYSYSFNSQRLRESIPNCCAVSEKLIEDFDQMCGKGEIDIYKFTLRRAVDISLREHYDTTLNDLDLDEMVESLEDIFASWHKYLIFSELFPIHKILQFLHRLKLINLQIHKQGERLQKILSQRVKADKIKIYSEEFSRHGVESEEEIGKRPEKIFKKLCRLHYHKMLTDEAFDEEILQFLGAGYATVAGTLSSIILSLGMYPEVQENLHKEISTVDIDSIDYNTLSKLPYLDRVVKENHRLFPGVTVIARTNTVSLKLQQGTIPAKASIFIPIVNIHRNPSHWGPDADQFNPDRFLPENIENLSRNVFLPFSLGKRNCIAGKFAEAYVRVAIIHLVRRYKFATHLKIHDLKFDCYITSKLVGTKHWVSIEKRM